MAVEQRGSPESQQPAPPTRCLDESSPPPPGAITAPHAANAPLEGLDWRIAAGFLALALVVRGVYLWQSAASPTFKTPIVDAMTYHFMAAKLAGPGHLVDSGYFWQPFFYPFFLAIVYLFSATSILTAKVVGIVIGSLTCALTYVLGRKVFDRRAGIVAAAAVAFYGPLVFWEADLMGDWMAAFWSVVLLLLVLRARDTKGVWTCFAIGLCGALAVLTRPTMEPFFLAAAAYLVWVFYRSGGWRLIIATVRNGLGGFLMVALPVAGLNYYVTREIALLPSSGGINFYIGNNADMCRTLTIRPGYDWEQLCAMPLQQEGISENKPGAQQAFYYRQVMKYMVSQPSSFLAGIGAKTLRFLCSRELPRNIDIYMFRKWSPLLSVLAWKAGGFGFPFGLLLPLAVAGCILLWRRIPVAVWLFLVLWPAAVILVFVAGRYRLPVVPAMAVVAAGGIFALIDTVRQGRWGRLAIVAACMAGLVALGAIPGPFCEEEVNFPAELGYDLGAFYYETADRGGGQEYFQKAADAFANAVRLKADYSDAYNNLGNSLARLGKFDEAIACLNKAVELNPKLAKALTNIGAIERKIGRLSEAEEALRRSLASDDRAGLTHYHLALVLIKQGRADQAVEHLKKAYDLDPNPAHRLWMRMLLADVVFGGGQARQAAEIYRQVLGEAKDAPAAIKARALKGAAWILATCNDPAVRNGAEAVKMAEFIARFSPDATTMDILAAAYAEAGMMNKAVQAASAALAAAEKAGDTQLATQIRARLQLYEAGQPCRSPTAYELPLP